MKHGPLSASNKLATIKQFIGTIDSIVLSTIGENVSCRSRACKSG